MPLEMTLQDLKTRGGILDAVLEETFDGAIVLDREGIVLHNTKKSAQVGGRSPEEGLGRHVSLLDPVSPFGKVLATGKPELGVMVVINGRKCMTDIHPVLWKGEVVGAIGALLFHSMNRLKKIDANYTFDDFIGDSPVTRKLISHCRNVARKKVHPILILGETGTGKEILASAFHAEAQDGTMSPFVKINCTAIPNDLLESELFGHEKGAFTGAVAAKKGKFELASGGSILLDEIGDMDLRLQSKLLRVLEEGEYEHIGGTRILPLNARIIASTNHELKESCRTGKFRPDLYYRLSTAEIRIPPLRARREDIPQLVRHLISKANLSMTFSSSALDVLMGYPWPGNVRELRNVLRWLSFLDSDADITAEEVLQVLADPMDADSPAEEPRPRPAPSLGGAERAALLEALESNQFNLSLVAKRLGVSRTTLYNKIRKHGIQIRKTQS